MEQRKDIVGKHIKIIFEDGVNHVSTKEGVCSSYSGSEIQIDSKHIIPMTRVIRIEVMGVG